MGNIEEEKGVNLLHFLILKMQNFTSKDNTNMYFFYLIVTVTVICLKQCYMQLHKNKFFLVKKSRLLLLRITSG